MSNAQADEFEGGVPFDLEEAESRRAKLVQANKDIDLHISDPTSTDKDGHRPTTQQGWISRKQLLATKCENERQISLLNGWIRQEATAEKDQRAVGKANAKLRDDFAKAALRCIDPNNSAEQIARDAYALADAMLVERERKGESGA